MSHGSDEILSVCAFLKQTPEGNLRKMLVDSKLTEAHFRILMKLAKGGAESDFVEAFTSESMGKLKLSAKEIPLRDNFWPVCKSKLTQLGLLTQTAA